MALYNSIAEYASSVGAFSGSLGATDNAVLRADGTGGAAMQGSIIQIDDSGNIVPATTDTGALGTTALMWSDTYLASGGVINWDNGDVTVTHAANTLAFAGAATGYTFADGPVVPATNDGAALGTTALQWSDLFVASGGVLNFANGDVTLTHSADVLAFAGAATGYTFADGPVVPATNDGAALGTTALQWSDLFIALGGVLNFDNGDVTISHSANQLAFVGANNYRFDALVRPVTNDGAPLGAPPAAWSDLFLASGGVVNFANGDVTMTHATTTLSFAGASTGGYNFDNPLFISESAAALGDTAGLGQYWVLNSTPNVPMFTDDAGSDFNLLVKHIQSWTADQVQLPTTNPATAGTRGDGEPSHQILAFDAATDQSGVFEGTIPEWYNGTSALNVIIAWAGNIQTTGDVVWNAAFERMDFDSLDLDAGGFAAVQAVTDTTAATAGQISKATIAFTNAQADGVQPGEPFRLKIIRDADNVADTLTGNAQLVRVWVEVA